MAELITCAHAGSRYCFCDVCVSVCTKSRKLLVGNRVTWYEYVTWGTLEVFESWWYLALTFDLERYFCMFLFTMHIPSFVRSFKCLKHSNFIFSVKVCFQNIYFTFEFQGRWVNIKVTTAKKWTQFNSSLIWGPNADCATWGLDLPIVRGKEGTDWLTDLCLVAPSGA